MEPVYRAVFRALAVVGRPVGGVRPRRIYHQLAHLGFARFRDADFRWHRDRWGSRLRLNPFYLIDRSIIATGSYEEGIHRLIRQRVRPGMVCFDAGANIGAITIHLAHAVSPGGKVHAFEPVPAIMRRLEEHVRGNGLESVVELHRVALSDRTGRVSFHYAPPEATNQGMGTLVPTTTSALEHVVEVDTVTLDDFVARHNIQRLDLIKADIQGAEPQMLRGGREALKRLKPDLVLEVFAQDLNAAGTCGRDLVALLEELGYRTNRMDEQGRPAAPLSAAEANAYDGNIVSTMACD